MSRLPPLPTTRYKWCLYIVIAGALMSIIYLQSGTVVDEGGVWNYAVTTLNQNGYLQKTKVNPAQQGYGYKQQVTPGYTFNKPEHPKPAPINAVSQSKKQVKERPKLTLPEIGKRFDERQKLLQKVCKSGKYDQFQYRFQKFQINLALGRLQWCPIPKVGSTFFRGLQKKVFGRKRPKEPVFIAGPFKGGPKRFFLVREPYSRLVSGFLGKLVTNPPWSRNYGGYIIRTFRNNATQKSKQCGHDLTFPEFVKYIIHSQETGMKRNSHFVPLFEMCRMCQKDYDYIVHLETLSEDMAYIFNSINITLDIPLTNEESTITGKIGTYVKMLRNKRKTQECETKCSAFEKMWWSFQARGYIHQDMELSLEDKRCQEITAKEFTNIVMKANEISVQVMDKSSQKREILASLFREVPLDDRLRLRNVLADDFEMFGYDPLPSDIFPELAGS